jgi:hypothetical protein
MDRDALLLLESRQPIFGGESRSVSLALTDRMAAQVLALGREGELSALLWSRQSYRMRLRYLA